MEMEMEMVGMQMGMEMDMEMVGMQMGMEMDMEMAVRLSYSHDLIGAVMAPRSHDDGDRCAGGIID